MKKKRYVGFLVFIGFIMAAFFSPLPGRSVQKKTGDVDLLYLDAQFPQLVDYFEKKDFQGLSLPEKLMFIDCLARISRGSQALEKLLPLLNTYPSDGEVLSAAGAVYLSLGDSDKAQSYIDQALTLKPDAPKALISRILLLLDRQKYNEAVQGYEKLAGPDREWSESELVFLVGIDVYRAYRDPQKLSDLFKAHAGRVKKRNKQYYGSLTADSRMYRQAGQNTLFQVDTPSEKVAVPFSPGAKELRSNTISITIGGKSFKVLLDTGNAAGWLVHSRDLNELLKPYTGGRTLTRIGSQAGFLDGYWQYYRTVDFNAFKIHHLTGIYVPKPHPDFPDANLNPLRIRDCVITFDFVNNQLVLHSKEKWEKDLAAQPGEKYSRLSWYGYKFPFVGVVLEGKTGLAMVETGAEDIALKMDFIKDLGLPLVPKVKYLADGQVFNYHRAAVSLSLGRFVLERRAAEVWPLDKFYNRLSGLSPDVVIGPRAFQGKFRVSFDPFDHQVIFTNAFGDQAVGDRSLLRPYGTSFGKLIGAPRLPTVSSILPNY